jgi:hypothetical protein
MQSVVAEMAACRNGVAAELAAGLKDAKVWQQKWLLVEMVWQQN